MKKFKKLLEPNNITFLLLIMIVTFSVYYKVLSNDFVYFDDDKLIFNNEKVTNPEIPASESFKWGFNAPHYKPLTLLSWRLEYSLFGKNPTVFHFNNLVLHILNSILVYFIAIFLLSKINISKEKIKITAFFISLLFALHPLHVESVAWATERKDVLFSLFFLLSWISYLLYLEKNKYFYVIIASIFYLLSVLSKSMGITLIAVLFITDFFYGRRDLMKMILEKIPIILVFFVSAYLVGIFSDTFSQYTDAVVGDKSLNSLNLNEDWQEKSSILQRLLIVFTKLFLWLVHIVLPVNISVDYNGYDTLKATGSFIYLIPFIIIGFLFWGVIKVKKHREILFGLLFFLVTISPALLTTDYSGVSTFLADRYTYIPLLGITFIFSVLIMKYFRKSISLSIMFITLFIFSILSFNAIKVWNNTETLWMNVIKKSKYSVGAYNGLGFYYITIEKNENKSIDAFSKGISILEKRKSNKEPNLTFGAYTDIYKNRALVFYNMKDYDSALPDLNEYLKYKPNDWAILSKRAIVYEFKNKINLALADLNQAIKINDNESGLYLNRGVINFKINDFELALNDLNKSIELNDTIGKAYNIRSQIYQKLNKLDLATIDKEKSRLFHWQSPISEEELNFIELMNKGNASYSQNNYSEARQYFEKCYPAFNKYGGTSKYPEFLIGFAHSLLQTNDVSRAKEIFKQVSNENPKNYFALKNLGFITFQYEKNYAQAILYYNRSLHANSPDYFQSYSNLGTIYLVQNQTDKAIENYELALKYGSSPTIVGNLFLLWKSKGNQEKMAYYQTLIKSNTN